MNRNILCIDLKSFYASVECIEKGLDPFTTPLVVANKNQGGGAITLAITPYLKKQGIKSRGRLFEIPKNIPYIIAKPRMGQYIKKSSEVINIYLDFISKDDLHVYSIDEAFLDVTTYLKLYKLTDTELAKKILKTIYKKTGLTATCGIGTNMLLAKLALDNESKSAKNGIAKWTQDDIKTKLWPITPLSNMWGIGFRMERNLNKLGIFSVGDLANYNKGKLKDLYGVIGEELHNHANGLDESVISEKTVIKRNISYASSQILFENYNSDNIKLIIKETLDVLTSRLRNNNKLCRSLSISIGYSKDFGGGFHKCIKLENYTDDITILNKYANSLLDKYVEDIPIRKLGISLGKLTNNNFLQLNLFEDYKLTNKENNLNKQMDKIQSRYGKSSIVHASALAKHSTVLNRNEKIGGHSI